MGFTVLCAADMFGNKHNLEIQFPHQPSLADLEAHIAATYQAEMMAHRPADVPPSAAFALSKLQVYDEMLQKWSDLNSLAQLREGVQLYAFQREAPWHHEVQKAIPPPSRPGLVAAAAPHVPLHPQPVAVPAVGAIAPRPLPDNATHDEKTRAVFEEFDVNTNKVIEAEEFKRLFRVLNFDLSSATVMDLFGKADGNRDGVVSYPEWQRFTEMYPTLLDSLYFRSRDHWEDVRQKQEIKAARDSLEGRKESERQAHVAHLEAQQATNCQEKRLAAAELALAETVEAEREAKNRLLDGQRDTEGALRERAQRAQDLELAKERERQRTVAHAEAQRDTDRAEQGLAWQESEQAQAQDKERQAANCMLEAQRETERARRVEAEASADLQAARDREQHANLSHLEEKRQSELAADRLNQAELELQQRVAREHDLEHRAREAAAVTEKERLRRDEEDRSLQMSRDHEQQAHMGHLDAQRAVEDQDKKVLAQEAERQAALQRRKQVEDQEKPLLEQEVRLREQRESLEEKEAKLRSDATAFHQGARAVGLPASPYRVQDTRSPRVGISPRRY